MTWLVPFSWNVPICALAFGANSRIVLDARHPLMPASNTLVSLDCDLYSWTRLGHTTSQHLPCTVLPIKVNAYYRGKYY